MLDAELNRMRVKLTNFQSGSNRSTDVCIVFRKNVIYLTPEWRLGRVVVVQKLGGVHAQ